MNRIAAIIACSLLLIANSGASAGTLVRKPLLTPPTTLRQMPAKTVCTDDQGNTLRPGDSTWTSRAPDGSLHDCTPFLCGTNNGACKTSAASTNDCRPGWNWMAPSDCSRCGPDNYYDDKSQTCKQGNPNPQ